MMKAMKFFVLLSLFFGVTSRFAAAAGNEIAYRYTDENDVDAEEDDEYFDAYGNKITATEYFYQHEQQSKKLQEEASKPFGSAGKEFGGLKKKKEEPIPIKTEDKPAETSLADDESEDDGTRKPRVLVS